jgi:hypothetical protein
MTDDTVFLGPAKAETHPLMADGQPMHPRMDLDSDQARPSTTAELAYFLKTTGPPAPRIRTIPELPEREESGVVKRMIELGVATFRKKRELPILEAYEKYAALQILTFLTA